MKHRRGSGSVLPTLMAAAAVVVPTTTWTLWPLERLFVAVDETALLVAPPTACELASAWLPTRLVVAMLVALVVAPSFLRKTRMSRMRRSKSRRRSSVIVSPPNRASI